VRVQARALYTVVIRARGSVVAAATPALLYATDMTTLCPRAQDAAIRLAERRTLLVNAQVAFLTHSTQPPASIVTTLPGRTIGLAGGLAVSVRISRFSIRLNEVGGVRVRELAHLVP
jgi:hypothetical protein